MKRLTNKNRRVRFKWFSQRNASEDFIADIYDKLKKLEDIEDELGIDLVTLFKALKEGIRTENHKDKTLFPCLVRLGDLGFAWDFMYMRESQYFLSDYGKTWALTKEELE